MNPVSVVTVTVSLATLVAGLFWPHLAAAFLQGLILALALIFVTWRAYRSKLPMRLATDAYSPFDGVAPTPPRGTTLSAIREMSILLKAADDPDESRRAPIPATARRILVAHVSRRLAEERGLRLDEASHHDRIRSLLSEPVWELIQHGASGGRGASCTDPVTQHRLQTILDEVEQI